MSSDKKVLHLTLKKKWYDMIASGEKREEYRDIKPYWIKRIYRQDFGSLPMEQIIDYLSKAPEAYTKKFFDEVLFAGGGHFGNEKVKVPLLRVKWMGITIDEGREDWGAEPGKKYFVIKLGEILK